MIALLAAALAYLVGSIPFAVIVSRSMGLPDPRSFGSGNPGATNVLRGGNKPAAVLTLLGDAAKGWLAERFERGDLRRVIASEHTGLLDREEREALEIRFKSRHPKPWYENLLSPTPTLEMGVDIGDLSQVMLCSVPPNQARICLATIGCTRNSRNAESTMVAANRNIRGGGRD